MSRVLGLAAVVGVMCCLVAGSAAGDRLILIPTGTTLTTGEIKAEYAGSSAASHPKAYWLSAGVSRLELEGARFEDYGLESVSTVSAQLSVLPETSFTPSVALGVRDISDESDGRGALYDGQTFYLAITKGIPVTGGVPFVFEDVRIHGGVGTGSLNGVFFGVDGRLPMGIHLAGEYDTDDFNIAASYNVIPALKVRVSSIKGDTYYGALFSTSF